MNEPKPFITFISLPRRFFDKLNHTRHRPSEPLNDKTIGAGINDMIGRLRYNDSLRHKKRLFKKDKSYRRLKGEFEEKAKKENIQLKSATSDDFKAIRKKILAEKKAEKVMRIVVVLIFAPLIIFGGYAYYEAFKPGPIDAVRAQTAYDAEKKERKEQYAYFISSGDEWLAQYNWYNAIFEYKKAVAIYPTDFNANYRLALAYTYNCKDTKENCQEAEQLILELLKQYENNTDLYLLRASYFTQIGDSGKAMLDYNKADELLEKNGLTK